MMRSDNQIGFVAFWKATDLWFTEQEKNKKLFMKQLEDVFAKAKQNGVVMHGVYDCSWSSEWRYFTFWQCPDLDTLEEICQALVAIGDINKYNVQRHFVGRAVEDAIIQ